MPTAAEIARATGPYNLPDGEVPVIDGTPRWPWDEAVARQRLARVAALAGLALDGSGTFVESGYRAAEVPSDESDPVRIADSTLTPLAAAQLHRLVAYARTQPHVDAAVLDRIATRLSAATRTPIDRTTDVLLHADCTPANVLIHWPAATPEPELAQGHPVRQLRHLADYEEE